MNPSSETTKASETSLARDWINFARYYAGQYLGGRRGLIVATLAVAGGGLALNWSWLVAIGVAPLLISLAPCAAMCALGLCMSRMGGKSCSTQSPAVREDHDIRSSVRPNPEASNAGIADEGEAPGAALRDREAPSDRS